MPTVGIIGGGSMGSRHVKVVLWAVMFAGVISSLSAAVQPEEAVATTAVKTCGGGSISLQVNEKRVLALHNVARTGRGLKPLCADPGLTRAARSHSREMIEKGYFSHSSYSGESVGERLSRFGYHQSIYAENIAGGSGTFGSSDSTFRRWMNSLSHKGNILDQRFRPVGVGTYTGRYKGTSKYTMYTVDFGVRR
jgi:uncharacterized protein YkwD